MAVDTTAPTGVKSRQDIAPQAEALHLSRAEAMVVRAMREMDKRGRAWQVLVSGNDAGVKIQELLPPRWEPK